MGADNLKDAELPTGENFNQKSHDIWDPQIPVESSHLYNHGDLKFFGPESQPEISSKPYIIDLFSGAGGISVGFEMAGFNSLLGIDIHGPSIESFRRNHSHAGAILGDISKVKDSELFSLVDSKMVSVVSAGVPCQGFSLSNRKRWQDDKRNFLFKEFIRIVSLINPQVILLENVSGMVSTKGGKFVEDISLAMSQVGNGYVVQSRLLNAADYGTPQTRKRLIFIGHRASGRRKFRFSWPLESHILKKDEDLQLWDDKPSYVTVRQALCDLPRLDRGQSSHNYCLPLEQTNDFVRLMRRKDDLLTSHIASMGTASTSQRIANTPQGEPLYEKFRQRIRLHPDFPSPTIVSGGIRPQFQNGHPFDARGLTIRERARLMSFPDSFVFEGGTVMGRVQTGQAVPPLLAKAIAQEVFKILD